MCFLSKSPKVAKKRFQQMLQSCLEVEICGPTKAQITLEI
jgi:hypothetical protein